MPLLSVIGTLWNARAWIVGGVALALIGAGLLHYRAVAAERDAAVSAAALLAEQLDQAVQVAMANADAVIAAKAEAAKSIAALERDNVNLAERAKRTRRIYEEINRAPASDDGPVAPVLGRFIGGVRQRAGPAPAH